MLTETNNQYIFSALNEKSRFELVNDNSSTVIYSSKEPKKLPLLAVVGFGFFATSPVTDYTMTEQVHQSNPIACLSKAVNRMEQATSLSFENGSLENFLHKLVRTTYGEAPQHQDGFAAIGIDLGPLDFLNDLSINSVTPNYEMVRVNVTESCQKLPAIKDLDIEPLYILDELF